MVNDRFKLGIIFNFHPSWMGGVIYIINLIKTLNFLEDREKPVIYVFYNPILKNFLSELDYPYLTNVEWHFPDMIKGNILSFVRRKNLFIFDILKEFKLDAVYPLQDYPVKTHTSTKLISWTPDFQHKHYPDFFKKKTIVGRHIRLKNVMRNNRDLVLSSHDAHNDLKRFYRIPASLNIHIYHFVSVIDDFSEIGIEQLRTKYNLPEKYYLISNQFHKHKNHRVAFLAIAQLKGLGIRVNLAITGKFPEASDSSYMLELHQIIEQNELNDQIIMLGVISRKEQLSLMKHSQAVVQPSLFEGWSTVIEDARSLQVPVISSNLNVNIEQLGSDGVYFDPHDVDELAKILKSYPERNLKGNLYEEYEFRVKEAASILLNIFRNQN